MKSALFAVSIFLLVAQGYCTSTRDLENEFIQAFTTKGVPKMVWDIKESDRSGAFRWEHLCVVGAYVTRSYHGCLGLNATRIKKRDDKVQFQNVSHDEIPAEIVFCSLSCEHDSTAETKIALVQGIDKIYVTQSNNMNENEGPVIIIGEFAYDFKQGTSYKLETDDPSITPRVIDVEGTDGD